MHSCCHTLVLPHRFGGMFIALYIRYNAKRTEEVCCEGFWGRAIKKDVSGGEEGS